MFFFSTTNLGVFKKIFNTEKYKQQGVKALYTRVTIQVFSFQLNSV